MKQPKRKNKRMVLCAECGKPIHIDDLGLISKEGMFHQECTFRVLHTREDFIEGYEVKIKKFTQKSGTKSK